MKKRSIAFLLASAIFMSLLAGCGGEQNNEDPIPTTLPEYTAGQITKTEIDENTVHTFSEGSTLAEFEKYCTDMVRGGYEKAYSRDTKELSCACFQKDGQYIYAYYAKKIKEARIVRGPADSFDSGCATAETDVTATPSVTMIGQRSGYNNGQGFVFVLPDGRLILQDGGNRYDDPDIIYNAIKAVAPDKDNIVIAAWFLSHPHNDHVNAFLKFVTEYSADETINIQRVIFNFVGADWYDFLREDGTTEKGGQLVKDVYALCKSNLPDTQVIKAHTGQIFDFGDAQVEILFTAEDLLPAESLGYINTSSMVIRVHMAGQSVLLLADTTSTSAEIMEKMHESSLYSTMVQLAHHGMWAGTKNLYFYVSAPVLLWPTLPSVAADWLSDGPVMSAMTYAQDVYIAGTELTTLELPYTFVGNRQQAVSGLMKK